MAKFPGKRERISASMYPAMSICAGEMSWYAIHTTLSAPARSMASVITRMFSVTCPSFIAPL